MTQEQQKTYDIGFIGGDGTGPEVAKEGAKVVRAAAEKFGFKVAFQEYDFGGDRYLRTGEVLPDGAIDELRQHDAILLGAIGHPDVKPGILEKGILLRTRFELDQYINLRPVKLYAGVETPLRDKAPEDIDFVVLRENTMGLYTGVGGFVRKGTEHEIAIQTQVYDHESTTRCLNFAFDYTYKRKGAQRPGNQLGLPKEQLGKLTLVNKTNVLTFTADLWERRFHEIGEKKGYIARDYNHVDACCMWMVKNPEWFDVIVVPNMFGDIITDLGAMVQGGMGIAAGGNINPKGVSMFEPIGGSAPKYTGKNVICPLASIEAGRMMLAHLGEEEAAEAVQKSVEAFTIVGGNPARVIRKRE